MRLTWLHRIRTDKLESRLTLFSLLKINQWKEAIDLADHIYALLGLLDEGDLNLSPDNLLTVEEAYLQTARYVIQKHEYRILTAWEADGGEVLFHYGSRIGDLGLRKVATYILAKEPSKTDSVGGIGQLKARIGSDGRGLNCELSKLAP